MNTHYDHIGIWILKESIWKILYFNGIHLVACVLRSCMLSLKYLNNNVIIAKLRHRYTEEGVYTPWLSNEGSILKMSKLGFNKQVHSVIVIFTHPMSVLMVSIRKVTENINSIKSYKILPEILLTLQHNLPIYIRKQILSKVKLGLFFEHHAINTLGRMRELLHTFLILVWDEENGHHHVSGTLPLRKQPSNVNENLILKTDITGACKM
jgi:hypothetical protein